MVVLMTYHNPLQADYDGYHYTGWRQQRLQHIQHHYAPDYFRGKTLLEVGAAYGHIGRHFAEVEGAIVTSTDHHQPWVDIIAARNTNVRALRQDLNDPWPFATPFDVIVSMGVLYHLPVTHAEQHLTDCCRNATDLILETDTVNNPHPKFIIDIPRPPVCDWWEPVNTNYCRPSIAYVERVLSA